MTSHIPTIQVLLDDGTGTYPTDVTSRVQLSAGVSVSGHGRSDEFTSATAGSFACTLRNDDGGLTTGLGFGLGPFGLGPFGGSVGSIYAGQGIRFKETFGATTVNSFTGVISELGQGWGGGNGNASTITVMAVDPLAVLARRPLRSMLEQEILLQSPSAYYTLGEAEGSTSAGDTSGNQAAPLTITGTGAPVTFGGGTGPGVDGLTAPTFAGGQYLTLPIPSGWTIAGFECWASSTVTPANSAVLIAVNGNSLVNLNNVGGGNLTAPTGGAAAVATNWTTDGALHHIVYVPAVGLYCDGVLFTPTSFPTTTVTSLTIGGATAGAGTSTNWIGTIAHFALYLTAPTGAQVTAHYNAGVGITETTAARFARIASYVGMTTSTPTNSGVLMAGQSTSGATALDALQSVADAEGGVFFANGTGTLVMQGRGYRAQKLTATLTLATKDVDNGVLIPYDTALLYNRVTATRTAGAEQLYESTASQTSYGGVYPLSVDLALANDSDVLSRAQWLVNKYSTPAPRMGQVSVRIITSSNAANILAAEIGDRWTVPSMPSQTWSNFGDLILEGWSRTLTVNGSSGEWTMTANLVPWAVYQSAIYDDPGTTYDVAGVYA